MELSFLEPLKTEDKVMRRFHPEKKILYNERFSIVINFADVRKTLLFLAV